MILYTSRGFNPFLIYEKDEALIVSDIRFYDIKKGEVEVAIGRGWFGFNNDIDNLRIPDMVYRRKEKFDGNVFAISMPKDRSRLHREVILYIPFDYFEFEVIENVEINHGGGIRTSVYTRYKSLRDPQVDFLVFNRYDDDEEMKAKARTLVKKIQKLEKKQEGLKAELKELDPHGVVRFEMEESNAKSAKKKQ